MDCQSIGARVRHHRKKNGLSQEELAERAETSRVYISNIERGEAAPSLEVLLSIANALSVSADDLLAGNLLSANMGNTEEEMDILFDCSQEESRILLESMKAIKQVLRGYNIGFPFLNRKSSIYEVISLPSWKVKTTRLS